MKRTNALVVGTAGAIATISLSLVFGPTAFGKLAERWNAGIADGETASKMDQLSEALETDPEVRRCYLEDPSQARLMREAGLLWQTRLEALGPLPPAEASRQAWSDMEQAIIATPCGRLMLELAGLNEE